MAAVSPNILFVHPDVKAQNFRELAALLKREQLSYASSGNGTTTHLGAELLFRNLMQVEVHFDRYGGKRSRGAARLDEPTRGSSDG